MTDSGKGARDRLTVQVEPTIGFRLAPGHHAPRAKRKRDDGPERIQHNAFPSRQSAQLAGVSRDELCRCRHGFRHNRLRYARIAGELAAFAVQSTSEHMPALVS